MNKSGKIAVIGEKDSILAFKAVGAEVFTAPDGLAANELLRKLVKEDYAIVFIAEEIAESIPDTLGILKTRAYPVVIPIPSGKGGTGYALKSMKHDVEKAIGADIIFNK